MQIFLASQYLANQIFSSRSRNTIDTCDQLITHELLRKKRPNFGSNSISEYSQWHDPAFDFRRREDFVISNVRPIAIPNLLPWQDVFMNPGQLALVPNRRQAKQRIACSLVSEQFWLVPVCSSNCEFIKFRFTRRRRRRSSDLPLRLASMMLSQESLMILDFFRWHDFWKQFLLTSNFAITDCPNTWQPTCYQVKFLMKQPFLILLKCLDSIEVSQYFCVSQKQNRTFREGIEENYEELDINYSKTMEKLCINDTRV